MSPHRLRRRLKQIAAALLIIGIPWFMFFVLPANLPVSLSWAAPWIRNSFALFLFWGIVIETHRLPVSRRELTLPGLSHALDGFQILHLSDLHVGTVGLNRSDFARVKRHAESLSADLLAITGDLVSRNQYLKIPLEAAIPTSPTHGAFAILGNSDQRVRESLGKELAVLKVRLLVNEHRMIKVGEARILVIGVDDPVYEKDDLEAALRSVKGEPDLVLLLAHSPHVIDRLTPLDQFACPIVVLAGHTHGGQYRWPGALRKDDLRAGLTRHGRVLLYVNRGIGHVFPFRMFCPPEVAVLTIRSDR